MSIEAMKQALEALNCINSPLHVREMRKLGEAMKTLRQAIEFREMVGKGTKAWADTPDDWVDELRGGAEQTVPSQQPGKWVYPDCAPPEPEPVAWIVDGEIKVRLDMAGKLYCSETNVYSAPPKQPEPEPEPYDPMENNADYERGFIDGRSDQMKSSVDRAVNGMAKREWVGLTEEELEQVRSSCGYNQFMTAGEYADAVQKATEAKLRKKNT